MIPGGKTIRVELGDRSYDVVVATGAAERTGEAVSALDEVGPVVVVSNETVGRIHGRTVTGSLDAAGLRYSVVEIPDGERFKTMRTVEVIHGEALRHGADRSTVFVALGGGVVGDVTGFAAASLFRGVRVVMVPTTLLAQVDSSVGGKTGVNRPEGKNLVGAFHQPSAVLSDTSTLSTLPDREYRAGLAEVVKYGVIRDADLFAELEARAGELLARDAGVLVDVVARSTAIKARVVEADEREGGLRKILNFGHTVGHAIEKVTAYERYLHGEAVAMGMVAAARRSAQAGLCGERVAPRISALLAKLGLETEIPADIDRKALVDAVSFDKKTRRDKVSFVAVEDIGRVTTVDMEPGSLASALDAAGA